jgi:hypothetical protein
MRTYYLTDFKSPYEMVNENTFFIITKTERESNPSTN